MGLRNSEPENQVSAKVCKCFVSPKGVNGGNVTGPLGLWLCLLISF
jgi:hypothetical protein